MCHGQSGSNCLRCGLWGSHVSVAENAELLFSQEVVCDTQSREGGEVSECSHPGAPISPLRKTRSLSWALTGLGRQTSTQDPSGKKLGCK